MFVSHHEIMEQYKKISPVLGYDLSKIEQGDPQWFFAKLGVISSSNAYRAIGSEPVRKKYRRELVAQIITREIPEINAPSLSWGHDNEDGARAVCEMHLKLKEGEIKEYPFIFKDNSLRVATSPDGISFQKMAGMEYKNPYNSANHLNFILDDEVKWEYQVQCQHQMYCMENIDAIFYGSYDRRMTVRQLHMKAFERDDDMMERMFDAYSEMIFYIDRDLKRLGLEFGSQWHLEKYKELQRS